MTTAQIQLPKKLISVFVAENVRYRGAYGGRGSAKTRSFALMTAVKGYQFAESGASGVILCAREFMNSLADSSMEEVKQAIRSVDWLNDYYDIGQNYIRTKNGLVSYVFCGLRHNLDSIKSKARILLCWVDEAENVSEIAWKKLTPTVREENSEIWVTWNPETEGSPTDKRFRQNPPENSIIVKLNYNDNPFFPDVLEQERLNDLERLDYASYAWIWEGAYLENSDKQVLSGCYKVEEFDDNLYKKADRLLFGGDFGFANDPNTLIRFFILDNCLYIEYEAYGVHVVVKMTTSKNLQKSVRIFSLRGAHLVAMFANTEVSKEVRKWLLDLADKEIGISETISLEQQQAIKQAVNDRSYRTDEHYQAIYTKLYEQFKIPRYQDLPANQFENAIKWLGGLHSRKGLSDEDWYDLAWLYKAAERMRYQIELIEPALRMIDSGFRGNFYSMAREYKRVLYSAKVIIERETAHIKAKNIIDKWNNVLPVIRLKISK